MTQCPHCARLWKILMAPPKPCKQCSRPCAPGLRHCLECYGQTYLTDSRCSHEKGAKTRCDNCQKTWHILCQMIVRARCRAKKRGIEFTISARDLSLPEVCPALGIRLQKNWPHGGDDSPSIDRSDPHKGYVPGNVRVISNRANVLKSSGSSGELFRVAEYVRGLGL